VPAGLIGLRVAQPGPPVIAATSGLLLCLRRFRQSDRQDWPDRQEAPRSV